MDQQEASRQLDGLFLRLHLHDRVAADQLLRLGEGPVGHGHLPAREPQQRALRAGGQAAHPDQHAGSGHLLGELADGGHEPRVRRGARLVVPSGPGDQHESHLVSFCFSPVEWPCGTSCHDFFCCSIWARRRCSCSLSSGVNSAPKSSASNTWRISTSLSVCIGLGQRLTHSTASSIDRTCHSQKPAISSLVSANGPSITVRLAPEKRTRLPFELGWSPSPASITPALTSSSLNLPISARSCSLGMTPASESLF